MDAETALRIADKQVKDSKNFGRDEALKLLMLAAGNAANARELNSQQTFFDGTKMQTCDTVAASIFRAQAEVSMREYTFKQGRALERHEDRKHALAAAEAIEKLINYEPRVAANYVWLAETYRYLENGPGMKRAVEMGLKEFPRDVALHAFQQENSFKQRAPTWIESWARDNPSRVASYCLISSVPFLVLGGGWTIYGMKDEEWARQGHVCLAIGAVLFLLYKWYARKADRKLLAIHISRNNK